MKGKQTEQRFQILEEFDPQGVLSSRSGLSCTVPDPKRTQVFLPNLSHVGFANLGLLMFCNEIRVKKPNKKRHKRQVKLHNNEKRHVKQPNFR